MPATVMVTLSAPIADCPPATAARIAAVTSRRAIALRTYEGPPSPAAKDSGMPRRPLLVLALLNLTESGQLTLPLRHHRGGDAIAQHIGRRAAHVEEVVDAEHQQQAGFGNVEDRQHGR